MNSKIVYTKRISAIFLAIVLVTGTIALYFLSFMTTPANAQSEPYYYETDEYTGYPMDRMANGYIDEEYKPQSTYYNDNNNYKDSNSVDIKKIKCNNINSNLNGLEGTTDLNSLLGVGGAESIQGDEDASANAYGYNGYKNNGNFDIDCINNNDNEGGQGQVGPQGPQGEQGPSQILPTNIYQVIGESVFAEDQETATSIAVCDQGDVVLSGSYFLQNPFETAVVIDGVLSTPDRWHASAQAVADGSIFIQSLATCFDNPPLRP